MKGAYINVITQLRLNVKLDGGRYIHAIGIQLKHSTKRVVSEHVVTHLLQRLKWNTLFISDGVIRGNPFIWLQSPWAGVFYETIALFSLLTAGEWSCLN